MSFISITGLSQYIFASAATWFIYARFSPVAQSTFLIRRSICGEMILPVDLPAPLAPCFAPQGQNYSGFQASRPNERGIIDVPCRGTNRKMTDSGAPSSHINFRNAAFLQSASAIENAPSDTGSEVAFAGRSNSGKSSAINTLTAQGKLARTSRTPGRTQLINFFSLSESQRLVDLPGYGFAKVPLAVKKKWNQQLERYLQYRESLRGLVMLMDVRHPLTDADKQMLGWAVAASMPVHILLTKADKLKRGPAQSTLLSVRSELAAQSELISVQLFSSLKRQGVDELSRQLNQWLTDDSVFEDLATSASDA